MASLDRWKASWRLIGAEPPRELFAELTARYCEPHRHYHTLVHLDECFAALGPAEHLADRLGEIELALWFHDAVYDPHRRDNEAESSSLAVNAVLVAGVGRAVAERIRSLILATTHAAVPDESDARLVVDVDLAILAAAEQRFDEYEWQIREEFAWVNEKAFRAGRARILRSFLARPNIYGTPWFVARCEAKARANLTRSVERLEAAY